MLVGLHGLILVWNGLSFFTRLLRPRSFILLINFSVSVAFVPIELLDELVDCRNLVLARIVASRRVLLLLVRHAYGLAWDAVGLNGSWQ